MLSNNTINYSKLFPYENNPLYAPPVNHVLSESDEKVQEIVQFRFSLEYPNTIYHRMGFPYTHYRPSVVNMPVQESSYSALFTDLMYDPNELKLLANAFKHRHEKKLVLLLENKIEKMESEAMLIPKNWRIRKRKAWNQYSSVFSLKNSSEVIVKKEKKEPFKREDDLKDNKYHILLDDIPQLCQLLISFNKANELDIGDAILSYMNNVRANSIG